MADKIVAQARSWAVKNNIHGPHAFTKYVIFIFVEQLNQISNQFIFKGGNLIWVYIKTPRPTIDLDLSTVDINSHGIMRIEIEKVCSESMDSIRFSLLKFEAVNQENSMGASARINYQAEGGATNTFDLDIVYKIPVDTVTIRSPVNSEPPILAASIENIIADKLHASWRFKAGNTRLKDYDDLWRITKSVLEIDSSRLNSILKERKIESYLNKGWLSDQMLSNWNNYSKRFKDLPKTLDLLFNEVNLWLKEHLKKDLHI